MSKVTHKELAVAMLDLLKRGKSPQTVANEVAEFLVAERRSRELNALSRELELIRYKQDDILEAQAHSAHDLSNDTLRQIQKKLDAKQVIIDEVKDDSVVGGVKVRALDKQLDLSIEAKLNQLRHITTKAA